MKEYRSQDNDYSCSSEQFIQRGTTVDSSTIQIEVSPEKISMLNGNRSSNNAVEIDKMRKSIIIVNVSPLQKSKAFIDVSALHQSNT